MKRSILKVILLGLILSLCFTMISFAAIPFQKNISNETGLEFYDMGFNFKYVQDNGDGEQEFSYSLNNNQQIFQNKTLIVPNIATWEGNKLKLNNVDLNIEMDIEKQNYDPSKEYFEDLIETEDYKPFEDELKKIINLIGKYDKNKSFSYNENFARNFANQKIAINRLGEKFPPSQAFNADDTDGVDDLMSVQPGINGTISSEQIMIWHDNVASSYMSDQDFQDALKPYLQAITACYFSVDSVKEKGFTIHERNGASYIKLDDNFKASLNNVEVISIPPSDGNTEGYYKLSTNSANPDGDIIAILTGESGYESLCNVLSLETRLNKNIYKEDINNQLKGRWQELPYSCFEAHTNITFGDDKLYQDGIRELITFDPRTTKKAWNEYIEPVSGIGQIYPKNEELDNDGWSLWAKEDGKDVKQTANFLKDKVQYTLKIPVFIDNSHNYQGQYIEDAHKPPNLDELAGLYTTIPYVIEVFGVDGTINKRLQYKVDELSINGFNEIKDLEKWGSEINYQFNLSDIGNISDISQIFFRVSINAKAFKEGFYENYKTQRYKYDTGEAGYYKGTRYYYSNDDKYIVEYPYYDNINDIGFFEVPTKLLPDLFVKTQPISNLSGNGEVVSEESEEPEEPEEQEYQELQVFESGLIATLKKVNTNKELSSVGLGNVYNVEFELGLKSNDTDLNEYTYDYVVEIIGQKSNGVIEILGKEYAEVKSISFNDFGSNGIKKYSTIINLSNEDFEEIKPLRNKVNTLDLQSIGIRVTVNARAFDETDFYFKEGGNYVTEITYGNNSATILYDLQGKDNAIWFMPKPPTENNQNIYVPAGEFIPEKIRTQMLNIGTDKYGHYVTGDRRIMYYDASITTSKEGPDKEKYNNKEESDKEEYNSNVYIDDMVLHTGDGYKKPDDIYMKKGEDDYAKLSVNKKENNKSSTYLIYNKEKDTPELYANIKTFEHDQSDITVENKGFISSNVTASIKTTINSSGSRLRWKTTNINMPVSADFLHQNRHDLYVSLESIANEDSLNEKYNEKLNNISNNDILNYREYYREYYLSPMKIKIDLDKINNNILNTYNTTINKFTSIDEWENRDGGRYRKRIAKNEAIKELLNTIGSALVGVNLGDKMNVNDHTIYGYSSNYKNQSNLAYDDKNRSILCQYLFNYKTGNDCGGTCDLCDTYKMILNEEFADSQYYGFENYDALAKFFLYAYLKASDDYTAFLDETSTVDVTICDNWECEKGHISYWYCNARVGGYCPGHGTEENRTYHDYHCKHDICEVTAHGEHNSPKSISDYHGNIIQNCVVDDVGGEVIRGRDSDGQHEIDGGRPSCCDRTGNHQYFTSSGDTVHCKYDLEARATYNHANCLHSICLGHNVTSAEYMYANADGTTTKLDEEYTSNGKITSDGVFVNDTAKEGQQALRFWFVGYNELGDNYDLKNYYPIDKHIYENGDVIEKENLNITEGVWYSEDVKHENVQKYIEPQDGFKYYEFNVWTPLWYTYNPEEPSNPYNSIKEDLIVSIENLSNKNVYDDDGNIIETPEVVYSNTIGNVNVNEDGENVETEYTIKVRTSKYVNKLDLIFQDLGIGNAFPADSALNNNADIYIISLDCDYSTDISGNGEKTAVTYSKANSGEGRAILKDSTDGNEGPITYKWSVGNHYDSSAPKEWTITFKIDTYGLCKEPLPDNEYQQFGVTVKAWTMNEERDTSNERPSKFGTEPRSKGPYYIKLVQPKIFDFEVKEVKDIDWKSTNLEGINTVDKMPLTKNSNNQYIAHGYYLKFNIKGREWANSYFEDIKITPKFYWKDANGKMKEVTLSYDIPSQNKYDISIEKFDSGKSVEIILTQNYKKENNTMILFSTGEDKQGIEKKEESELTGNDIEKIKTYLFSYYLPSNLRVYLDKTEIKTGYLYIRFDIKGDLTDVYNTPDYNYTDWERLWDSNNKLGRYAFLYDIANSAYNDLGIN